MTDWELLQRWVAEGSREALGEVVRRYLDMVYATARREVADEHLAEDITQAVFLILMRRANHISSKVSIGGWLFKVTRFAAADARKSRARRRRLEQEVAQMKPAVTEEGTAELWTQTEPALNEAIAGLREADRNAIVMKYLEGKSHAEVAATIWGEGGTENRARQQLFRAIKKLREALARRGIVAEDVMLANVLESRGRAGAPAEFGRQIMGIVLGPGSFSETVEALSKGTLKMMTRVKLVNAAVLTAAVVTLATGGLLVGQAVSGGTSTAPAPAAVTTSAPASTQAATTQATMMEEDKIRDVLLQAWKAHEEGNVDGFVQAFDQPDEDDRKRMAASTHAITAAAALEKQFLESYKEKLPAYMSRQMRFGMDIAAAEKNATATINGNTAKVNLGNMGPGTFEMVKVNGEWKISMDVYKRFNREVAELTAMQKVLDEIRENIKSGKLATSKDAEAALLQAWMNTR